MSQLSDLFSHRDLLWLWIGREIRIRYKQSVLGAAWAIIQPKFEAQIKEAVGLFKHFAETQRATTDLETIISAAHFGRIEVLLMALGAQQMGTFDRVTGDVQLVDNGNHESIDLVNHAARRTLLARGSVYALPRDEMPDEAMLAAVLRY